MRVAVSLEASLDESDTAGGDRQRYVSRRLSLRRTPEHGWVTPGQIVYAGEGDHGSF